MALAVGACAASPEGPPEFAWLKGCWRSEHTEVVWRADRERWIGEVAWDHASCSDQPYGGGCSYIIQRDANGEWEFRDAVTDDIQTFGLEELSRSHARFRASGHPMRPRPLRRLDIRVSGRRLEMLYSHGEPEFVGERC